MIFTIEFFRIFNNFCREKKFLLVGIGIHYCSLLIWITSSFYQQNKCSFFFFLQWIIVKVIRQPRMRTQNTHVGQKSITFNIIGPFDLKNTTKWFLQFQVFRMQITKFLTHHELSGQITMSFVFAFCLC